MTEQHVTNHWKQVFSEYGWPETLISDNGPCYTGDAFTSVINAYHVNHITSSPHYPQPNGLAEKYVQIMKSLFHTAKEGGKDLFKCLMIYHNTPLSGSLPSLMQILQNRSAISDLPISNAAKQELGLHPEKLRTVYKNEHFPSHDIHIGQAGMFQDVASKQWYPATITSLCAQPRSYNITTRDGVTHRKAQAHLKSYHPQCKKTEDEHSNSDMWTLKLTTISLIILKVKTIKNNLIQDQRETLSLQLNLIYDVLSALCINKVYISCLKQIAHK